MKYVTTKEQRKIAVNVAIGGDEGRMRTIFRYEIAGFVSLVKWVVTL